MNRSLAVAAIAIWALASQASGSESAGGASGALRAYVSRLLMSPTTEPRFRAAETDLNGDGRREVIVHVTNPELCGSGGCLTLVLERIGGGYRAVMRATITRPPIRVLRTRHRGWKDIGVLVCGGGITNCYEAAMAFDGRRYPSNPTMPPARRLRHPTGQVLIAQGE